MSISLFTEVKWQWATLTLGWVTSLGALLVFLMDLRLAIVDRNSFRPCLPHSGEDKSWYEEGSQEF